MVYIKELLPNPAGKDTEGEWIKLINDSGEAVSLVGWRISDAGGNGVSLSNGLDPGDEITLPYSATKISLNNDGDTITLYNPSGSVVDEFSYSGLVGDDEIIFGDNFLPQVEARESVRLESLAFSGGGAIVDGSAISTLFIAVVVSAAAGVIASVFVKNLLET